MKELIILCLAGVVYLTSANKVPFITKCKWDDEECIKKSTQAAIPIVAEGIPEMNVEKMDPLHIKSIDASSQNLKLLLNDIVVTNLKQCEAIRVRRDAATNQLFLEMLCSVKLVAKYDMDGKILLLPLTGKGDMRVDLNKILINATVDLEVKKGKDGVDHWNIKKWKHTFELKDRSNVEFDNLFDGNEVLGKAVKDTISKSGNEVIIEIGQGLIKSVIGTIARNCNKMFHAVPLEDLILS